MENFRQPVSFLATDKPDAARIFYTDVLGLELRDATEFPLIFLDGDHVFRVQITPEFQPPSYTVHGSHGCNRIARFLAVYARRLADWKDDPARRGRSYYGKLSRAFRTLPVRSEPFNDVSPMQVGGASNPTWDLRILPCPPAWALHISSAACVKASAVKGIRRSLIPMQSWIAFAMAATVGPGEASPAPTDG